jgi:hypothetical protein
MKNCPWIWLIIANVIFISGMITLVVIAVRNKQPDVLTTHGH